MVIAIAAKMKDGKATAGSLAITVTPKNGDAPSKTYRGVDDVPEEFRQMVRKLIKNAEAGEQ